MKTLSSLLVLLVLSVSALSAQTTPEAPTPTESLTRIEANVVTGAVTAYFKTSVVIDGQTYARPTVRTTWNSSTTTVTVGALTLTYGEVMQLVVAIAQQERAEQLAAQSAPSAP